VGEKREGMRSSYVTMVCRMACPAGMEIARITIEGASNFIFHCLFALTLFFKY
jgi:hypothetical protein